MENSDFSRLHLNVHSESFSPEQTSTLQFMHCSLKINHPHCHATHFHHDKFHILSLVYIYQPIGPHILEGQSSSKVPRGQNHIKHVVTLTRNYEAVFVITGRYRRSAGWRPVWGLAVQPIHNPRYTATLATTRCWLAVIAGPPGDGKHIGLDTLTSTL